MKPSFKNVLLALALGLGWLLPQCAQAFYNPSTGRWISRDPAMETGGKNLYVTSGNNPASRVDRLGLKDFAWEPPEYHPDQPIAKPPSGGGLIYGATYWKQFTPRIKTYQRPGDFCCYGLMFDGETAQLLIWWHDEDARTHEFYHRDHHYYPVYLDYKAEAKSYFPPCKPKRVAECLKGALEGPLAEAYKALGYALALRWDCSQGDSDACGGAPAADQDYLSKAQAASDAIRSCLAMP